MRKILHLSYDLRDRYNREVTTAVSNLINVSRAKFNPFIIDLVRVQKFKQEMIKLKESGHLMINVFGLPYGLLMYWSQNRAYNFVSKAESQGLINLTDFNLIHAHKLTFEGVAGLKLAQKLNIPLVVTLRQTDTIVFNRKPGSIDYFKPVIKSCHRFFYLIPQILVRMKRIFGDSFYDEFIAPKAVFLPNIVDRNISQEGYRVDRGVFLIVLRMTKKSVKRKNLKRLLHALKLLDNKDIKLRIIGDGEYKSTIHSWVGKLNLQGQVLFEGAIPNKDIDKYFGTAEAFLLPSLSETFGMVYAEALLNGTPIMYSKDYLGFDGVFEGVGVGVNPISIESISDGISDLLKNSSSYREKINSLEQSGEFNIFSSNYIKNKYNSVIEEVCNEHFP